MASFPEPVVSGGGSAASGGMDVDEHNRRLQGLAAFRDRFTSHYRNNRTRLPVPSDEQFEIMWLIHEGYHVKIEAVPGSGKTTTAILYAQFCQWEYGPGGRCNLHLTYSSPLKMSNRESAKNFGVSGAHICEGIHSFCHKYYLDNNYGKLTGNVDLSIAVAKDYMLDMQTPKFDTIIIDEAQDLTELYFCFLVKLFRDTFKLHGIVPQLVFLGEARQALYNFNGGDERFLSLCDHILLNMNSICAGSGNVDDSDGRISVSSNRAWRTGKLSVSHRATHPMAQFLSKVMLGREGYVVSAKENDVAPPVKLFVGSPWSVVQKIAEDIRQLVYSGVLEPGEIFVLCNSVEKSYNSPMMALFNALERYNIRCHLQQRAAAVGDVERHKVLFSTFCSSKGREKRCVVVLGFNRGYFQFPAKELDECVCPNPLWVAASRASGWLMLQAEEHAIRDATGILVPDSLKFIDKEALEVLRESGDIEVVNVGKLVLPKNGPYGAYSETGAGAAAAGGALFLDDDDKEKEVPVTVLIRHPQLPVTVRAARICDNHYRLVERAAFVGQGFGLVNSVLSSGDYVDVEAVADGSYTPNPPKPQSVCSCVTCANARSTASSAVASSHSQFPDAIADDDVFRKRGDNNDDDDEDDDFAQEAPTSEDNGGSRKRLKIGAGEAGDDGKTDNNGAPAAQSVVTQPATPANPVKTSMTTYHITDDVRKAIGISVPAMLESALKGGPCSIEVYLMSLDEKAFTVKYLRVLLRLLPKPLSTIEDFLHLALIHSAIETGAVPRIVRQLAKEKGVPGMKRDHTLKNLNASEWVSEDVCMKCHDAIKAQLGPREGWHRSLWEVQMEMSIAVDCSNNTITIIEQVPVAATTTTTTVTPAEVAAVAVVSAASNPLSLSQVPPTPTRSSSSSNSSTPRPPLSQSPSPTPTRLRSQIPTKQTQIVKLQGILDVWTDENMIIELKCTNQPLSFEFKLQLLLYRFMVAHIASGHTRLLGRQQEVEAVLHHIAKHGEPRFSLLSYLSGERWELTVPSDDPDLHYIVQNLLVDHVKGEVASCDEEFKARCDEISLDPYSKAIEFRGGQSR